MKKLFSGIIAIVVASLSLNAQSNTEEVDLFQSIFGMEKKAMVETIVTVDEASKTAFWNLYDEYEAQRKELGKQRIALLNNYANNYSNFTDESLDRFMAEGLKHKTQTDALIVKYYKKIRKSSGSLTATQFYHIESLIASEIRSAILENIPYLQKVGN